LKKARLVIHLRIEECGGTADRSFGMLDLCEMFEDDGSFVDGAVIVVQGKWVSVGVVFSPLSRERREGNARLSALAAPMFVK